jgi:uncharacterized membrane protein
MGKNGAQEARPGAVGDPVVAKNVATIASIEEEARRSAGVSQRLAGVITRLAGSMLFVWLHVVWFSVWLLLNTGVVGGIQPFDDFPFVLLTTIVSLEAIFLSTFVLISQNHESLLADRRTKLDLQINMLAEQEVTRMIGLLSDVHQAMGLSDHEHEPELKDMRRPTQVEPLAKAVEAAEKDA